MTPSLFHAVTFAALASLAMGCASTPSGSIGDPCLSSMDCVNTYECLPVYPDGGCSKPLPDGAAVLTCQQTCSSECSILEGNYVCSAPGCGVPGVSAICRAASPTQ